MTSSTVVDDEAQTLFPGNNTPSDGVANVATATGAAGALFSMGSDGLAAITITPPAFSVIAKTAQGFAQTESISWSAGVRGADGTTTWTATSTNHTPAATLIIKADGSYSFTLNAPLAHSGSGETNNELSFGFSVTDGDGDKASGTLKVNVNDDAPNAVNTVNASRTLDDEAQTEFTPTNTGWTLGDTNPNYKSVSGGAGTLFSMGSDGLGSITVTPPAFSVIYKDTQGFAQTEAVTWDGGVRSADGTTTWTATSGNYAPAATLIIKADGSYSFSINAPVAHSTALPGIEEDKTLSFNFSVTDGDGDTASGKLNISVNDDTPVPVASIVTNWSVMDDEAQTEFTPTNTGWSLGDVDPNIKTVSGGAGALFTVGADGLGSIAITPPAFSVLYKDAQGFAQTESVSWSAGVRSADGTTTWTATSANHTPAATLIIKADGSYSFTMDAPLAHSNGLLAENTDSLSFGYGITDGDGDQAGGVLTVLINDDRPISSNVTASTTLDDEAQTLFPGNDSPNDGVANVATASGAAGSLFSMGADGLGSITIAPPAFSVISKDAQGFAQTESISWSAGVRGADGTTTWTATSANHTPAATLIIKADGSYSFTLNAPLAHSGSGETNNELSFGFSVTDGDGDKASGTLKINVNDDAPVKAHDYRYVSVQEADIAAGPDVASTVFENKMGADGLGSTAFTGHLKLDIGGGVAGNVSLDVANGPVTVSQFTSDGKPVTFVLVNDTLVRGYILPENGGGTGGTTIIEISLTGSDQGATTKLFGPIDHIAVVDGKPIDSILVDATVRFTDGDGDDITAIIRSTIVDDVPSTNQADRYITLSENNIASGTATDTRAFTIDFGSDGYGRTFFTGKMGLNIGGTVAGNFVFNVDAGPQVVNEIKSGGKPITFEKVGDNVINGYITNDAGQRVDVIKLELNDTDTNVTATLFRPIDHVDVGTPTPLGQIRIDATVGFADGDGDVVTSILRVNVNDSTPTLMMGGADVGSLSEVNLPQVSSTFGNLGVNVGADKNGHVAFAPGVIAALQAQGLTSDNVTLQYTIRDNGFGGEELVAYKAGSTADDPVFIVGVYKPASFAATLFQNVDHAANSDSLPLNLTARVYDGDGDYADRAFTINVADDAPTLNAPTEDYNLLTNGDFSIGAWSPTSYGGASTGAIGWLINGTQPGQAGVQLEQVTNGYMGMSSTSGVMVDLAASPGNVEISQTLSGLNPNSSYTLSFEIGSPDPASAGLEVYWNGVKLNTTFTITNQMTVVTVSGLVPNGDGKDVLTFKEVGSPDNTGTYLADVKLAPTAAPDLPLVEAQMGEDGTAVFNFSEGTDFDFGADGKGSVAFDANAAVISTPSGTLLDKPTISYDPVTGKLTINPGWGFNGLSKNEIATLTIPFSVTDADGDVRTGLYRITILGSDDPVTSSVGFPEAGTITEYAEGHPLANSTDERTSFDSGYNGGGFWIYGDQGDTHTVTVVPVGAGQLGHITHQIGETTANDGVGFVNWKYNVTDQELNYLAAGQTKVEEFDIVVSDPYGNSTTRRITITLVGSNDTPVITVAQGDSIASELIETNAGLQAAGTLSVSDVDVTDVVTASVGFIEISGPPYGTNLDHAMIRSFMTVNTPVIGNGQTTGTLNWSFNSNSQAFNFLPQGSRLVFKYTIVVTDSAGATDEQIVTVAINGTNDAPVISMPLAETTETIDGQLAVSRFINETDTGLASSGTLTVSDVDNVSAMTVQVIGVSGGGAGYNIANAANFLTISPTAPIYDAGETANNLSWSFNSGSENFNFLSQGTQIRLNYTIRVTDNFGASVDQVVTILINGTNDGPVVDLNGAAAGVDGATYAVEGQPRWAFDAATLSDVDSSNLKSMTVGFGNGRDPANANGETETLTLNTAAENARAAAGLVLSFNATTGALTISGNASVATYQTILRGIVYQNNNDTPSAQRVLEVSVTDDYNAVATAHMVVNVTPVNDPPELRGTLTGSVTEGGTMNVTAAMLSFYDPDNTNVTFLVSGLSGGEFLNGGAPATSFTAAEVLNGLITFRHFGGEDPSIVFQVRVEDGNQDGSVPVPGNFTINVTDVNDPAIIDGATAGQITEDAAPNSVSGLLTADDVDNPDNVFQAGSGTANYGTWSINAGGQWTYVLDNANPTVNALNDGQDLSDSFAVKSADGTIQLVTITIAGKTDATPIVQPPVVNALTGPQFAYAFVDNAKTPNAINFDARTLFSGSGLEFSFKAMGAAAPVAWLSFGTNGVVSGGPNNDVQGLYRYEVTATDPLTGASNKTYVAFAALGGNAYTITNSGNGNSSGLQWMNANTNGSDAITVDHDINATLNGGSSNDVIIDNLNGHTVDGGDGDDAIYGGAGGDTLRGGASGHDFLDGGDGIDFLYGGSGDDILLGGLGGDTLDGEDGHDILVGGTGNDTLFGGNGDDILIGGPGQDTISTGFGFDTVVLTDIGLANRDTVTDFSLANDKIDLTALLDANFSNGDNISDFVDVTNTGVVRVDQSGSGNFAADGSSDIALLNGVTSGVIKLVIDDDTYTLII
ncbi:VCBS domain-containing protein [Devosia riboflavina]|uniref:VCBS domain-containing protein n=1 Tax=Devosia riboflavina TaxID=46914 RepID=UPI00136294DB|nr:VCBS domain-containing protein [Devosia riboflavina]